MTQQLADRNLWDIHLGSRDKQPNSSRMKIHLVAGLSNSHLGRLVTKNPGGRISHVSCLKDPRRYVRDGYVKKEFLPWTLNAVNLSNYCRFGFISITFLCRQYNLKCQDFNIQSWPYYPGKPELKIWTKPLKEVEVVTHENKVVLTHYKG